LPEREVLTAETQTGRAAVEEVMGESDWGLDDLERFPPEWERVLLVDGVPVTFVLVQPDEKWELPSGSVPCAFLDGVATRPDRRREGHFRYLMEHTFDSMREAGIPAMRTHGPHCYYRAVGFEVYAHNYGIFATPAQIERLLGPGETDAADDALPVQEQHVQEDLLLVVSVQAEDLAESRRVLRTAATLARRRGKDRILFENPCAGAEDFLQTPFAVLARACGARCAVQGAEPEGTSVGHADWIRVIDAPKYLEGMAAGLGNADGPLPEVCVAFDTDAGAASLAGSALGLAVHAGVQEGAELVRWPSYALAQLAIGYLSAEVLATIHDTPLGQDGVALLDRVFPTRWGLARDESWTY